MPDVQRQVPAAVEKMARDPDVLALFAFGSLAEGKMKLLSDLDFGILLSEDIDRKKRFDKHIDLIRVFNDTFRTDEMDLVILNDGPTRFAYTILKTGKLLFCRDHGRLSDFKEKTVKRSLDFKPVREQFDQMFLEGIGYHG